MLKIGLIGFGFMGRMHFDNYERLMNEGHPIQLSAICDIQIEQLKSSKAEGNMATEKEIYDLSPYRLYENIEDMLANEQLDMIDITLPTYLHAELTCNLLERGYHVFCEKPAARNAADARIMAETASKHGKKLMIGQCLRFWPAYEVLKETVESGNLGQVTGGYFFRGSEAPKGWFMNGELSGGCLLDMHIHDTDMIHWLFGKPDKVSTLGRSVVSTNGYDIVSTNYVYPDGKVINAQADWTLEGDHGFEMTYRVNFEKGNMVFKNGTVNINPKNEAGYVAELSPDAGYYRELLYFTNAIVNETSLDTCSPESAAATMEIIEAEIQSADQAGAWVDTNKLVSL
ncbi:MAG: Gfo/Idh/MocA family oxidoreductase [Candidatus Pristimantibacillus lignocellulolyticus]|uniref:Gfo/Idh/MocA family oxidoreductase n=1 Tax=Candidatus Pristimantibacillus lignocellulolyticus TaxID=2994561 RepID=A0A9J6ZH28_9BACL|nr:MAG: Gfo/Idh/MocA family oxidoreductase [Candidatus Pristimantibacillus lignocellulolyticus]